MDKGQLLFNCVYQNVLLQCIRAVPEIILGGMGRRHFFVLWGEGVLLTMCLRGGGGVTCPGGQGLFDP